MLDTGERGGLNIVNSHGLKSRLRTAPTMDELIIRYGCMEGPRNPTSADVCKALDDVESFALQSEEFCIEKVSNWQPDFIDGHRVIRCVREGPYMVAGTFGLESSPVLIGWLVLFYETDKQSYALAAPDSAESDFVDGYYCGGPLSVRSGCLVPREMAFEALEYFVDHHDRSPDLEWLSTSQIYRFR